MADVAAASKKEIHLLDDPISFWDSRHSQQDRLRSGGDIGLTEADNHAFYAVRLGHLVRLIGPSSDPTAPLSILDAGCGKGWFTERLAEFGHNVLGIDSSVTAVDVAREEGAAEYAVSTLDAFAHPWLFDVVVCIDVLFHILDDALWARSVETLAAHVALGGTLILTDVHADETQQRGSYIIHRATHRYLELLKMFEHRNFTPYDFKQNPNGFHVFVRTG